MDNIEDTEAEILAIITNEASEPIEIPERGVVVVFKRPSMVDKFKQRAWGARKLRSFGLVNPDVEEPNMTFFFRYWAVLNSYISRLLVVNTKGDIKVGGKKYEEYQFDAQTDLDYSSLFEKYVMEEIYEKGHSEEAFVSEVMSVHSDWLNSQIAPEEDDIKNS